MDHIHSLVSMNWRQGFEIAHMWMPFSSQLLVEKAVHLALEASSQGRSQGIWVFASVSSANLRLHNIAYISVEQLVSSPLICM
jgi:hypothetical protein